MAVEPVAGPDPKPLSNRQFWLLVAAAVAMTILGSWLSTGSISPYGTHIDECGYRYNSDSEHFHAVFRMLEGAPEDTWNWSVVLRRILHPILAYPWVKAFGYELGGFLFNVFALVIAQLALAIAIRRYFDARASVLVTWLYATYPGFAYWVGLPYSYGFIVPGSTACLIALLWWHDRSSLKRTAIAATIIGVAALGYDLMPYFGGALILLLLAQRRWRELAVVFVILAAFALFISRGLPAIFGFPAFNTNTQVYTTVFDAWMEALYRLDGWGDLLLDVPGIFLFVFFYSNFLFLPSLFLVVLGLRFRFKVRPLVHPVALAILLATLGVFLFLNLAPPPTEKAWHIRGIWIARIYQPWFVAILLSVAATSIALRRGLARKLLVGAVLLTVVLDALTIVGPVVGSTYLYGRLTHRFYYLEGHHRNSKYVQELGARPYGFCKKTTPQ
jgi:hypothetical protein